MLAVRKKKRKEVSALTERGGREKFKKRALTGTPFLMLGAKHVSHVHPQPPHILNAINQIKKYQATIAFERITTLFTSPFLTNFPPPISLFLPSPFPKPSSLSGNTEQRLKWHPRLSLAPRSSKNRKKEEEEEKERRNKRTDDRSHPKEC